MRAQVVRSKICECLVSVCGCVCVCGARVLVSEWVCICPRVHKHSACNLHRIASRIVLHTALWLVTWFTLFIYLYYYLLFLRCPVWIQFSTCMSAVCTGTQRIFSSLCRYCVILWFIIIFYSRSCNKIFKCNAGGIRLCVWRRDSWHAYACGEFFSKYCVWS